MSRYIRVEDCIVTISPSEGLDAIYEHLREIQASRLAGYWTDVEVRSVDSEYDDSWTIWGWRLETESEHKMRLRNVAKVKKARETQKAAQLEAERAQYERLKKKFG